MRKGRKKGPKLEIPQSQLLMYGVTNQNIKEKLGMAMGGGTIPDLTR